MNLDLKTGAPSVKVPEASLLRSEKSISDDLPILISNHVRPSLKQDVQFLVCMYIFVIASSCAIVQNFC